MRHHCLFTLKTLFLFLSMIATIASADDVLVQNISVSGNEVFTSEEDLVLERVIVEPSGNLTAIAVYDIYLRPGTRIKKGARFLVKTPDGDGLHDRCEMYYYQNLEAEPDLDDDFDGLSNLQECLLSEGCWNGGECPYEVNPKIASDDHDGDGLLDTWEIQYAGLDLNAIDGRNGDDDGDGVSNWIEYRLGTNPLVADLPGPGIFYKYDELGRILKIERIPAR